ncbi:MAG: ribosomal protein S18-alanine N-acetyltransferase [Acidimicrobiales bacterium]
MAARADDLQRDPVDLVVTLMPMRRRHLRAVLRIEGQAEHRGWSLGLFMGELANERGRRYLVAKVGGTVVGFAGMLFLGPDGHVTTISVDRSWRGRGIGTRLMLALCREAVERGATAQTLEVRAGNEPAQAMYRIFGFAPAGIRRNYYQETNEDALVMWAHDVDGADYSHRLDRIGEAVPGRTIVEAIAGSAPGERS